jgi:hypothetical protein
VGLRAALLAAESSLRMSMSKLQMQLKKKEKERKDASKKATQTSADSKAKSAADAQAFICLACRQPFMVTTKPAALSEHAASKHPKLPPEQCFPCLKPPP